MKVLAPIDGASSSQSAVDALIGMQWENGSQIKLLRVVAPVSPGTSTSGRDGARLAQQSKAEVGSVARDALQAIAAELQQLLPQCRVTFDVLQGDAKSLILGMATDWSADLILMGSRGNSGIELFMLGSVSQGVLNQSPCPVLIVKSEVARTHNTQEGFKNVLLTVDDSVYGRAALEWVKNMTWSPDTRITLVTVVEAMPASFKHESNPLKASRLLQHHDSVERAATSELQTMAQDLASLLDPSRIFLHVEEGDPKERITYLAKAWNCDLIVMGSHGRSGITKLVLGSVSQAVSVDAPCAVAVIRGVVSDSSAAKMQQTGMFKKLSHAHADLPPEPSLAQRAEDMGRIFFGG